MFVIVVQKVLLLHLSHTFPEPGGTQVSHQINAFHRTTVQSSTGRFTSCPRQPYTLTTCWSALVFLQILIIGGNRIMCILVFMDAAEHARAHTHTHTPLYRGALACREQWR